MTVCTKFATFTAVLMEEIIKSRYFHQLQIHNYHLRQRGGWNRHFNDDRGEKNRHEIHLLFNHIYIVTIKTTEFANFLNKHFNLQSLIFSTLIFKHIRLLVVTQKNMSCKNWDKAMQYQDMLTDGRRTKAKSSVQHSQMFKDSACCMCVCVCVCPMNVSFRVCNICVYVLFVNFCEYVCFCVCTCMFLCISSVCTGVLYTSMYMCPGARAIAFVYIQSRMLCSCLCSLTWLRGCPQLIQWNVWKIETIPKTLFMILFQDEIPLSLTEILFIIWQLMLKL